MPCLVLVLLLSFNVAVVKSGIFGENITKTTMCAMCEDNNRYVIECGPDNHFVTVAITAMAKLADKCSSKHNCSDGTIPSCCELQQENACVGENEPVFEMHLNCMYTSRCVVRWNTGDSPDKFLCQLQEVEVQFYTMEYACAKDEVHMVMKSNNITTAPSVFLVTDGFPALESLGKEDWVCSAETACGDQIELYLIDSFFMEYGLCPVELRVKEDGESTVALTCNYKASVKPKLLFVSKRNFVTLRLTLTSSSVPEANVVFYMVLSATNGNVTVRCGTEFLTTKLIKCSDDPVITTECTDCPNEEESKKMDMFSIILILFGTVIMIVIIAMAAILVNQSMKRKKRRGKRIRVKPITQTKIRTLKALPEISTSLTTKQPLPGTRKLDPTLIDTRLGNVKSTNLNDNDFLNNNFKHPNELLYSHANHGRGKIAAVQGDVLK